MSRSAFERLVAEALDGLPESLGEVMDNVVVVVDDLHPDQDLLGLYEGVPLTERADYGGFVLPDRITLYRLSLCAVATSYQQLVDEIRVTVVHEVAHHFGIDDDDLDAWGWG